ncbi:MAG: hypothetical protein ABL871_00765 [Terricaulis sp.]
MRFIALLALTFLAACSLNDARLLTGKVRATPAENAVIIFGVRAEQAPRSELRFRFEQQDAERANCFAIWTRLEVRIPPGIAPMRYYAFIAPPGRYQLFGHSPEDFRTYQFEASAGHVQYIGDFSLRASPYVARAVDAEAAADVSLRHGLSVPELTKVEIAEAMGPMRYCTI